MNFRMSEDSACKTSFKKLFTQKYNYIFCRNSKPRFSNSRFAKHRSIFLMLEKTLFWLSVNLQKGP